MFLVLGWYLLLGNPINKIKPLIEQLMMNQRIWEPYIFNQTRLIVFIRIFTGHKQLPATVGMVLREPRKRARLFCQAFLVCFHFKNGTAGRVLPLSLPLIVCLAAVLVTFAWPQAQRSPAVPLGSRKFASRC
jgi:hypothetical protein